MNQPSSLRQGFGGQEATDGERRFGSRHDGPVISGIPVREDDVESTRGLHSVAILFRVLAGLLAFIVVLEILNAVTSPVVVYGALLAEVIRLVILAGLLWGAGELADLFVQSHHDLRSVRITLARLQGQEAINHKGRSRRNRRRTPDGRYFV
jgi:hypothetical protein